MDLSGLYFTCPIRSIYVGGHSNFLKNVPLTVHSLGFPSLFLVMYFQLHMQCSLSNLQCWTLSDLSSSHSVLFLGTSHFFYGFFIIYRLTSLNFISLVHASFLSSRLISSAARWHLHLYIAYLKLIMFKTHHLPSQTCSYLGIHWFVW